jgi:ComF family protein
MAHPAVVWLRNLAAGMAHLVYPKVCWVCGQFLDLDSSLLCPRCAFSLTNDPHSTCPRCSSSVGPFAASEEGCVQCRELSLGFDRALRLGPYEGLLREVILRMKHQAGEGLAEAVANLAAERLADRLRPLQPSLVMSIPLHWTRRLARGFNQSETLARRLAKELGIPCRSSWLRRTRRTPLQTEQPSPAARLANVHNAFQLRPGVKLAGQVVVLVDDVMTTGATLGEAARALRPAKPAQIVAAVLAHGH